MNRSYYADSIIEFVAKDNDKIVGQILQAASADGTSIDTTQINAWLEEISILKKVLIPYKDQGTVYFEYSIPRLGKRIDVLALIDGTIFVIEFKVGQSEYTSSAIDQVCDYALDLKNFHETSHLAPIAPILVPTLAKDVESPILYTNHNDKLLLPIKSSTNLLSNIIQQVLEFTNSPSIDRIIWENGRYHPTPTIVEAAMALYGGHKVEEISRTDNSAENLRVTSRIVSEVIKRSRANSWKSICFVTGVPGAGKTLVGLDIATKYYDRTSELYSVYLSGNGPLLEVLREALAVDKVRRLKERGERVKIGNARSEVKSFIQNVHHFRNDCLQDRQRPPIEHVAIFDEAQRAWDLQQTSKFLQQRGQHHVCMSEPEFLISCLDRHTDWAVIVCLVGGGQEINTGEAGIREWLNSVSRSFPQWRLFISSRLGDSEYNASEIIDRFKHSPNVTIEDQLHLRTSMRSFRAEHVSSLVNQLLNLEDVDASNTLKSLRDQYPIMITRDLRKAKQWLRDRARGNERYGLLASSSGYRLKPHAIDVRWQIDPVQWFLNGKDDVRSSYYLEDAATEYKIQGLELDWACVTWDADFRRGSKGWEHWKFVGEAWNRIHKPERQKYLKNAYRVLLTRARQGMVIVVPEGDGSDPTRKHEFYDPTFEYLSDIGFMKLG